MESDKKESNSKSNEEEHKKEKKEEEKGDNMTKVIVNPSENLQRQKIKYQNIGEEGCEIDSNEEDISLIGRRIGEIKNLNFCNKLRILSLRQNLIEKIEGLENLILLEELELYDNRLKKIENIEQLVNLRLVFH